MNLDFTPKDNLYYRKGNIDGLNILKLVCSFLVICIHVGSFMHSTPLLRLAVPIFYFITGYFLVDTRGVLTTSRVGRMLKRLLWLTIGLDLVYAVFKSLLFGRIMLPQNGSDWFDLLFVGTFYNAAFWYLNALIVSLAIIWVFVKCKISRLLILFIPLGLLTALTLGTYLFFWSTVMLPIPMNRNFFTIALPCLIIGVLARRGERYCSTKVMALGGAILIFVSWCEFQILKATTETHFHGDIFLLTIPTAVFLFFAFKNMSVSEDSRVLKFLAKMGAKHSSNIYFYHILFLLSPFQLIFVWLGMNVTEDQTFLNASLLFLLCLPFSAIIRWITHKSKAYVARLNALAIFS